MPTIDPSILIGAGAGAAVMLVLAIVAVLVPRQIARRAHEGDSSSGETDIRRLFEQLDLALFELRSHSEAIERMSARVESLATRLEAQGRQSIGATAPRGYDTAIRMARTGASSDELVAASGVTRQEARLLTRLHGREKRSA